MSVQSNISAIHFGSTAIARVYKGSLLVEDFTAAPPSSPTINAGTSFAKNNNFDLTSISNIHTVNAGDSVVYIAACLSEQVIPTITSTLGGVAPDQHFTHAPGADVNYDFPIFHVAVWDNPTPGAHEIALSVTSGDVRRLNTVAYNISNKSSSGFVSTGLGTRDWGYGDDVSMTLAGGGNNLVIGAICGRDPTIFTGQDSANMTGVDFEASAAADAVASVLAVFSAADQPDGSFTADMNFTGSSTNWVLGVAVEL